MPTSFLVSPALRFGVTPTASPLENGRAEGERWRDQLARNRGAASLSVLIVVEPGLDGVFRHVEGLVDFLLRQRTTVHLAYSSRRCGTAMRQLVEQVRHAGGQALDLRVTNIPHPRDILALVRLSRLVRRIRPDVIHAHSSKAGALARLLAGWHHRPRYIYTPHAYYGLAKSRGLRVRFFNQIETVLGRCGRTVAISQDEADFALNVLRVPAGRLVVIHNPVDTARFRPASVAERRAARSKLGIAEDALVLATIGRMCWQKDPDTAYKAVAIACAGSSRLKFLHLGWGDRKESLHEWAQRVGDGSRVQLLDYVDDPRGVYHAVDGVLLTSRYEAGWPLVFLEAMACDLPVVAATCPGMSDVGKAGLSHVWTFAPEDVAACAASIGQWLAHHSEAATKSNHRSFAIERLSPERCYGALFDLYCGGATIPRVSPLS